MFRTEHSVDELADDALQAAAPQLVDRVARGVPAVRGATHRLRERRLRVLRRIAHARHTLLPTQLRYADQQGELNTTGMAIGGISPTCLG